MLSPHNPTPNNWPHARISGSSATGLLLLILLLGGSGFVFSHNFYLVNTSHGIRVVAKTQPGFDALYVDASHWTTRDLIRNRNVALSMTRAGLGNEIPQVRAFNHAVERGVQSVQEFDQRYRISNKAEITVEKMKQLDNRYQVSARIETGATRVRKFNERHQVTQRIKSTADKLKKKFGR